MRDTEEPLYQVWATETKTGQLVPVPFFPRAIKDAVTVFQLEMRRMIREGKEKRYADPQVLVHLGLPEVTH